MNSTELLTPILKGGIRNTNFFNGRLLTAEDLKTEQQANRQQHQQLGQAIGEGIVYGLQVEAEPDVSWPPDDMDSAVQVTSGLALNRKGQALFLPSDETLTLVSEAEVASAEAGLFTDCEMRKTTALASNAGMYILVMSPASGYEGRAPMSGSGSGGKITGCGSRYITEGVQFRLEKLELSELPSISSAMRELISELISKTEKSELSSMEEKADLSTLRNVFAHLCFRTEEMDDFPLNPFVRRDGGSPFIAYSVLDALPLKSLGDCDVPLALIYWAAGGIRFVDMGSVRRRPVLGPPSQYWPLAAAGGYPALGEAIGLQFQEHLDWLKSLNPIQNQLSSVEAVSCFRYLPAAGIVPVTGDQSPGGFHYPGFFGDLKHREPPAFMEGSRFGELIRTSLAYPPIDLNDRQVKYKELIRVYVIRENRKPDADAEPGELQSYMAFSSAHIPYQANARFDVSYLGYSNYAKI